MLIGGLVAAGGARPQVVAAVLVYRGAHLAAADPGGRRHLPVVAATVVRGAGQAGADPGGPRGDMTVIAHRGSSGYRRWAVDQVLVVKER